MHTVRPVSNLNANLGAACLTLFGLPFLVMGLLSVAAGVRSFLRGPEDPMASAVPLFVGALFALVGGAIIGGGFYARKKSRKLAEVQARHPESPWLWKEEWTNGRIQDTSHRVGIFLWVFAVFWNLVTSPLYFLIPAELAKGNSQIWIAALFPLVGLCLLAGAIRSTLKQRKFGSSVFRMTAFPAALGGQVQGTIETQVKEWRSEDRFLVRLTNLRRITTGTGKNRSTSERVLWSEEKEIAGAALTPNPNGAFFRVSIPIPADASETNEAIANDQCLWRLEVSAELPGIDFSALFEIPVFGRVEGEGQSVSVGSFDGSLTPAVELPAETTPIERIKTRILVARLPSGATHIYYPAARAVGMAVGVTMFTAIWIGATWLMISFSVPICFPIGFVLFAALLLFSVVDLWFGTTTVIVHKEQLTVQRSFLIVETEKVYACKAIEHIRLRVGARSGRHQYYNVELECGGKKIEAGRFMDKREAEAIAGKIRDLVREGGGDGGRRSTRGLGARRNSRRSLHRGARARSIPSSQCAVYRLGMTTPGAQRASQGHSSRKRAAPRPPFSVGC